MRGLEKPSVSNALDDFLNLFPQHARKDQPATGLCRPRDTGRRCDEDIIQEVGKNDIEDAAFPQLKGVAEGDFDRRKSVIECVLLRDSHRDWIVVNCLNSACAESLGAHRENARTRADVQGCKVER